MKYLVTIILPLFFIFSSCDKCKDKDCQNGATCNHQNGDPICTCPNLYEGDRCETETRSNYIGSYRVAGTAIQPNGDTSNIFGTYKLEAYGTGIDQFKIIRVSDNYSMTCTLNSSTSFSIDSHSGSNSFEGAGTLSSTKFALDAKEIYSNGTSTKISLVGTKK